MNNRNGGIVIARQKKKAESSQSTTIFDDVFRTLVEKTPRLLIPVINECFGKHYPEDAKIIHRMNEHMKKTGDKIITDTLIQVDNILYHIECQSTADGTMAIRMIEYDFMIALNSTERIDSTYNYRMTMPHSCALYLRHNSNTPDALSVTINFADGTEKEYQVPIIKVQNYTKDEMFQKHLLFFFPYYIMRYEKSIGMIEKDSEKLHDLLEEYREIVYNVRNNYSVAEANTLCELAIGILEHVAGAHKNVKKEVENVMGGKVLELEWERRYKAGVQVGHNAGVLEGEARGREAGILEGEVRGHEAGVIEGKILITIQMGLEYGANKEKIISDLQSKVGLTKEEALKEYDKYMSVNV